MVFRPEGMTIYRGTGPRLYRLYNYQTAEVGGMSVYRGKGQVGHGLGGLFRSLSKVVVPAAKSFATRAVKKGVSTAGAKRLLRAGTRKLSGVAKVGALKKLTGTRSAGGLLKSLKAKTKSKALGGLGGLLKTKGRGGLGAVGGLLKSVNRKSILGLAKKQATKVIQKAKKAAAPALAKASAGLVGDVIANKNPQTALAKRTRQASAQLAKSIKRQAPNVSTSFTTKQARRRVRRAPAFQQQRRRRITRPTTVYKGRGRRRRQFRYKPARPLDIWEI